MLLDLRPLLDQPAVKYGDSGDAARAYHVTPALRICPVCHHIIGETCTCPPDAFRRRDEDLLVLLGAL